MRIFVAMRKRFSAKQRVVIIKCGEAAGLMCVFYDYGRKAAQRLKQEASGQPIFVPHSVQNLEPGAKGLPQEGQAACRRHPQEGQNFAPGMSGLPQEGQIASAAGNL